MDRAPDFESVGWEFESPRGRQWIESAFEPPIGGKCRSVGSSNLPEGAFCGEFFADNTMSAGAKASLVGGLQLNLLLLSHVQQAEVQITFAKIINPRF